MSGASGEGVVPPVAAGPAIALAVAGREAQSDETAQAGEPELGRAGRLLVGAALVGGLAVGALSGFGLFWFIPYGAVAAVLVIRRPRHPIGWILLAMAWVHVLLVIPINATVADLEAGPPPSVAIPAMLATLAASAILPLYGLLAFVVPSGHLPSGRWGQVARVALVAAVIIEVILAVAPTTLLVLPSHPDGTQARNPLALAPESPFWDWIPREVAFPILLGLLVTSAASLVDRVRRARGVERQQLRWIGASLVLVVSTFLLGIALPIFFPNVGESATLPAVLAFATVPIAIGIAVLRYRLYDIDTIINRAIVYGLLTAILAGASAAAVGLTQTLFLGVLGPGSTTTIVITTLLVVSAFNPIKSRLEALVDRRFKPAPDPATVLKAFTSDLRESVSRPDRERALRRLLDLAVPELATAAEARWTDGDGPEQRAAAGPDPAPYATPIRVEVGAEAVELRLAGMTTPRTEPPLREAMTAVLEETRPATS